jgi:hypothetical protein
MLGHDLQIRPMQVLIAAINLAFRLSSNLSTKFKIPLAAVFSFPFKADEITKLKKLTFAMVEAFIRI